MSIKRGYEDGSANRRLKEIRSDSFLKMAGFRVGDKRSFDKEFPHFREPVEIGHFSLDISRTFHCDKSQLKYFIKPKDFKNVRFDLTKGYSEMIKKDETKTERINDILRWILRNKETFNLAAEGKSADSETIRNLNTDFICWRGLLTKLLCTPYENRDDWKIAVTLHNGTYYLCEFDTEAKKKEKAERTERQEEMCCWGWKFEQYLTADSPEGKPSPEAVFNNCEAFGTVVRSRLASHSLVFSGEVDAIDVDPRTGKSHYVEFKTSREFSHPGQHVSFKRYKLIKMWAQSFLVGIPEIVCGFRDDEGTVHRLETFQTNKIPYVAKDIRYPWKANVCFNFLDQFLLYIKATVKEDNHRLVHLFEWNPGMDVQCTKLALDSDYTFLPDWYINS
ncbi:decapping and exoribonuclease protein-like [Mya arenaria]|uniref:decapping and exoribonuclease protein-like n=1 Tax=Mya arenaria TaxID=6604 RepID=UPI0022E413FA|nr:decapping and exoribonuclease protein-like [Mya arenaria]